MLCASRFSGVLQNGSPEAQICIIVKLAPMAHHVMDSGTFKDDKHTGSRQEI